MAHAGAAGLTPLRVRAVRAFLEAAGYTAVPGTHQHLKLRHPARPPVLLPLRPQGMLAFSAARQIGAVLGYPDAQAFIAAVTAQEPPPASRPAPDRGRCTARVSRLRPGYHGPGRNQHRPPQHHTPRIG